VIKSDFIKFLREFHAHGRLVKCGNNSFIVLILENSCWRSVSEYRPIALIECMCNVL
jgi:hypothetical protein